MPDRPPADQLRRIETRLNAIVVLLSIGLALALFVAVRQAMYWIPYLLVIGVITVVVAIVALVAGWWLTSRPSPSERGRDSGADE